MRRRGPTVNVRRSGPGLIKTAARTAVIAGTATAVSKGVSGAMSGGKQAAPAQQPPSYEEQQALAAQQALYEQQQALAAQQAAAPPPPAPEGMSSEQRIAALKELAELKAQGILTEEEFASEKARILSS